MKFAILVLCVVFCGGCVSRQDRPTDWPQERTVQNARDVEGAFVDVDSALRTVLWPVTTRYSGVRTVVGSSTLQLEFVLDGGAKKSVEMPFTIKDGWLVAKSGRGVNRDGAIGYETITFHLRVDATGSLIVRYAKRSVGTLFFVPVAGTAEYWSRLPKENNVRSEAQQVKDAPPGK